MFTTNVFKAIISDKCSICGQGVVYDRLHHALFFFFFASDLLQAESRSSATHASNTELKMLQNDTIANKLNRKTKNIHKIKTQITKEKCNGGFFF